MFGCFRYGVPIFFENLCPVGLFLTVCVKHPIVEIKGLIKTKEFPSRYL